MNGIKIGLEMTEMAAVVSWYGPYASLNEARAAALKDYSSGLYVAFGYPAGQFRGRARFLYVGVGDPLSRRLIAAHHKVGDGRLSRVTSIWLGEIDSHGKSGRRLKKIDPLLDAVEWAMIALLQPCLNDLKKTFPRDSFAIMNRWWKKDYETPALKPAQIWPDLIECAGGHAGAHLCWLHERKVRFMRRPRAKCRG